MTTLRRLNNLFQRQEKIEKELDLLKKAILMDDERYIRPEIFKKWERISHNLDKKGGRLFSSTTEMKKWLAKV